MTIADLYPALTKAAIAWVLVGSGSAPRLTTLEAARPYVTGQRPLRVGVITRAQRVQLTFPAGARAEFAAGESEALTISPWASLAAAAGPSAGSRARRRETACRAGTLWTRTI